jgi:hypothetical protein
VLLAGGLIGLWAFQLGKSQSAPLIDAEIDQPDVAEDDSSPDEDLAWEMPAAAERQPIDLQFIPAGTRIVIHLHPDELWRPGSRGEEIRFCLGPISEFLAAIIRDLSHREPAEISEALFCLIPGERGTPPDLAAVFHLREEAKRSQLIDEIGGQRMESGEASYYVAKDKAYFIPDLQTIAVCPANLAGEMVSAIDGRNPTSPAIDELLLLTDRSRPVTVLFEPVATKIDAEFLMPPSAIPLLDQVFDWLGPEVEAAVWSVQWQSDLFWSEIIVRNQGGQPPRALERHLQRQLEKLAGNVLHVVEQMSPREAGKRKVIGRFPVMMRAFSLATRTQSGPRSVTLVTRLPERAAPNLALGALLAWDESTRTDLRGKPKPSAGDVEKDKPDNAPLAEKLKRKITVEFNREPLQGAFSYIANEIKAQIDIDGDALKLAAYTKNMPQTFTMENAPAIEVIQNIFRQPMQEKLCLVVDEPQRKLLITTFAFAEQKGLTPYEFQK